MKIFNLFFKTITIHIVDMNLEYIKKSIKLKKIPNLGERIYFEDNQIWNIVDILHHIQGRHQVVWVVVEKNEDKK